MSSQCTVIAEICDIACIVSWFLHSLCFSLCFERQIERQEALTTCDRTG